MCNIITGNWKMKGKTTKSPTGIIMGLVMSIIAGENPVG
jgi:hypothetical protein